METPGLDIQFYEIAVPHQGKVAADGRFGTDVQHDRPVRRSAHAGI